MSPNINDKYYSLENIKVLFSECKGIKNSDISTDEYNLFCDWLHFLPKNVVDKINDEIYFVLMSAKKKHFACYLHLDAPHTKKKKAIIYISSLAFASQFSSQPDVAEREILFRVLHEVAHHTKGHIEYKNQKHKERIEEEADAQAKKWLDEWDSWHRNM